MRHYVLRIAWNHKGTKYEKYQRLTVAAGSARVAVYRAMKTVKEINKGSWREPKGSEISINILALGEVEKEVDDGRRGRIQRSEES